MSLCEDKCPVSLREVSRDNWQEAFGLEVEDEQLRFIAEGTPPVAIALAKAFIRPSGLPATPYAVYAGYRMVGFFNLVFEPGSADNYWVFHYFIDRRFQRRGYGMAGLEAMVNMLRERHPESVSVSLTVHPENEPARQMYSRFGFEPTGECAFGEPVFRLDLAKVIRGERG